MDEKRKAMILGSFLGDSLALGVHWIYDVDRIQREFGRVDRLSKPLKDSYHPTKDAGEFTHYGDQTLVLLESVVSGRKFDLRDFAVSWRKLFENYSGYFDHATKGTLKNLAEGRDPAQSGSNSSDLAGAARIAPLVAIHTADQEELVSDVRAQTAMTHNHPVVLQDAEFFARTLWLVLSGMAPIAAMENVCADCFHGSSLDESVSRGLASAGNPTIDVVLKFGQSCDARGAFPAVIHLIARYENNLRNALIENVMAGGDSAARGMLVGMVLGAHLGMEAIPFEWLDALKRKEYVLDLLERL